MRGLLALLLLLAACAPGGTLAPKSASGPGRTVPAPSPRFEALAQAGAPAMLVSIEAQNRTAGLLRGARNGATSTWYAADNTALSFRHGLLVATRGLGHDLMSADVAEAAALLRSGRAGMATRIHRYLGGEDQIITRAFVCAISTRGPRDLTIGKRRFATRLVQERCKGPDTGFQNLYWIAHDGRVIQSRQWVGPGLGAVALRVVAR